MIVGCKMEEGEGGALKYSLSIVSTHQVGRRKREIFYFEVHVETDTYFASGYYFLGYEDRILVMTFTQVYPANVKRNQWLLIRGKKARIKRLSRDF